MEAPFFKRKDSGIMAENARRCGQIATWQSRMTDGQETAAGEGGPSRLHTECAIIRAAILP